MTLVLLEPDVATLPRATSSFPIVARQVTPLREAFGLPSEEVPGHLVQAQALADRHADSPIALARLAQAAQSVGDAGRACDAARAAVAIAVKIGPAARHALHAAALVLAVNDAADAAAALALDTLPGAALIRASFLAEKGEHDLALLELAALESPLADAMRGWLLLDREPAAAVTALRSAATKGLRSPDVLVNLGYALAALGSDRKAARVTREATMVAPLDLTATYNLIVFLRRLGRNDEALAELSRAASAVPNDVELALRHAWAHVHLAKDPATALRLLKSARDRVWNVAPVTSRAKLDASIDYLGHRLGLRPLDITKKNLWLRLQQSENNAEVAGMLASLFTEPIDGRDLRRLLRTAGQDMAPAQLTLQKSRLALLESDIDAAVSLALDAAALAPLDADIAGYAAYLVGEVRGDYSAACAVAEIAYTRNADWALANNFAFVLALAGRHADAQSVIDEVGGPGSLPFAGATAALALLCAGRLDDALASYDVVTKTLRRAGEDELAGLVDWRRRMAMVELGMSSSSTESLEEPAGREREAARAVMRAVRARVLSGKTARS